MKKTILFTLVAVLSLSLLRGQEGVRLTSNDFIGAEKEEYVLTEEAGLQEGKPYYKPWSISMFLGKTIGGPAANWEQILKTNHFNHYPPPNWFSGLFNSKSRTYPYSSRGMDIQLRFDYRYRPQRTYGGSIYESNKGVITGYNNEPFGGQLEVNYGMSGLSVYHQWFFGAQNSFNVYAGLSLNKTKLSFESMTAVSSPTTNRSWKPGLIGGFQLSVFEKANSYLRVNLEYHYLSALKTRPLLMLAHEYDDDGRHEYTKIAIPANEVPFSAFSLGIVYGVRMGRSN